MAKAQERPPNQHAVLGLYGRPAVRVEPNAYHEAGHAVAAFLEGIYVRYLTVTDGGGGCCQTDRPWRSLSSVFSIVAGLAAEIEVFGPAPEHLWDEEDPGADVYRALALLREQGREHLLNHEVIRASNRLHEAWPAVDALAARLQAARYLDGAEAVEIIREHLPSA